MKLYGMINKIFIEIRRWAVVTLLSLPILANAIELPEAKHLKSLGKETEGLVQLDTRAKILEAQQILLSDVFGVKDDGPTIGFRLAEKELGGLKEVSVVNAKGKIATGSLSIRHRHPLKMHPRVADMSQIPGQVNYKLASVTGQLIGDIGATYVYGMELTTTLNLRGQQHKVTTFTVLDNADLLEPLEALAAEHADLLNGNSSQKPLDVQSSLGCAAKEIGASSTPQSCNTCGYARNEAINLCDFIFQICSTGATVALATAIAGCASASGPAFPICIASADLVYTAAMSGCFFSLNTCFRSAEDDYRSCLNTCDGGISVNP